MEAQITVAARRHTCPACLRSSLEVSEVVIDLLRTDHAARYQYSARCPECGLSIASSQDPVPIDEVVGAFIDTEVAAKAYLADAFSHV